MTYPDVDILSGDGGQAARPAVGFGHHPAAIGRPASPPRAWPTAFFGHAAPLVSEPSRAAPLPAPEITPVTPATGLAAAAAADDDTPWPIPAAPIPAQPQPTRTPPITPILLARPPSAMPQDPAPVAAPPSRPPADGPAAILPPRAREPVLVLPIDRSQRAARPVVTLARTRATDPVTRLPELAPRPDPARSRRREDLLWPGMVRNEEVAFVDPAPPEIRIWEPAPALTLTGVTQAAAPRRWRVLAALLALGVVAGLGALAANMLPGWLRTARAVPGVFNAPMMVVRAAVSGRTSVVGATPGQLVEPQSLLLSFETNDPGRPTRNVVAGVHGLVRSVETVPGAEITRGAPLVRLHDCDRAFVTVPAGTKLAAGDRVDVALAGAPVVGATMRLSSGIMEPPDTVVASLPPGTLAGTCPVGAAASITPAAAEPAPARDPAPPRPAPPRLDGPRLDGPRSDGTSTD